MSSFVRNMQRAGKRGRSGKGIFFMGRGSKLGTRNPKAKDLLARLAREAKRAAARTAGDA